LPFTFDSSPDKLFTATKAGDGRHGRQIRGKVSPFVILALSLGTVDTLLGHHIANRLQQPALADLARDKAVNAVLKGVDLFDAGHFALVELLFRGIAGLVVLGEILEEVVFNPGHPGLVLLGVLLLGPLRVGLFLLLVGHAVEVGRRLKLGMLDVVSHLDGVKKVWCRGFKSDSRLVCA